MNNKKKAKWAAVISSAAVSIYTFLVFAVAAFYTFFKADDFSHANTIGIKYETIGDALLGAVAFTEEIFYNWQGTYFAMFCQAFLSPLNGFGVKQLKIVMVLNIVLIFASIFCVCYAISKYLFGKVVWHYMLPFYAMIVFSVNAYRAWIEIYYWFSGATSFSIPLSFMLFSIGFYLLSSKCKKKKTKITYAVISAVCMFCASGGSLEVAGTGCYLILILACMETWKEKRFCVLKWGIFLAGFIGALINTIAPGNYVRYRDLDASGKLHIWDAIEESIAKTKYEADWMLNTTSFMAILILAVIVGLFAGKYITYKKSDMLLFTAALTMTPLVTVFPVMVAYENYFPNRCLYVLDVVMVMVYLLGAMAVGCLLRAVFPEFKEQVQVSVICILLSIVSFSGNDAYDVENLIMVATKKSLAAEEIQEYSLYCRLLYDHIAYSAEDIVEIPDMPYPVLLFGELKLVEDKENWMNKAVAQYYGKEAILVKK